MELNTPEPEKVPVINYEFTFATGKTLGVALWPSRGDKERILPSKWVFTFPRLKLTQEVERRHLLAHERREMLMVYIDPAALAKKHIEKAKQKAADKDTNGKE